MIAITEEEKQMKARYTKQGAKTDEIGVKMVETAAERARREEQARLARLAQEEEARKELQNELRRDAYQKYGRSDVYLNRDGSMAKIGDGDYVPVEEMKRALRR